MTNKMPAWNLSDYYTSMKDAKIAEDLESYRQGTEEFAKRYKGKLAELSAEEFLAAAKNIERRSKIASRLGGFAYLNMVTQMKNVEAVAFYQDIQEKLTDYCKPAIFFSLEFNALPDAKINEWLQNKDVAFYKYWIKRMRKFKDYELSEPVEEILVEKSLTSSEAWVRLYEETSSRLVYTVDGKEYNDAELSKLMLDKNPQTREKAGKELNRVLKENGHLMTFIYNMVMKDKAIEDEKRGFKTPVSSRNLSEDVSDEAVEVLAQTVKS